MKIINYITKEVYDQRKESRLSSATYQSIYSQTARSYFLALSSACKRQYSSAITYSLTEK